MPITGVVMTAATRTRVTHRPRRTNGCREGLAKLQDSLREFNDAAVASRVAGVLAGPTAPATVAIEAWSAARTGHCADAIDTAWARYAKARPFWMRD